MSLSGKFDAQRLLAGAALLGAIALAWKIEKPSAFPAPRAAPAGDGIRIGPDNGPPPAGMLNMPLAWWKRVLIDVYAAMSEDRLVSVAAGVVFYALLAIFPAITAFVSFYGLFADPTTVNRHLALLADFLPEGGLDIVAEQVGRIAGRESQLSLGFIAGLAVALWSANAGVKAIIDALNVIQDQDERRGIIRFNALSLTLTLGGLVFLLLAVGAVVAFPLVMSAFGLMDIVGNATWLLRWPALLAVALLAIVALYRFGPSQRTVRWKWLSPGTFFAAFAWLVGSSALSFYLSNFADYNATYGSLGAAIGLMIWMWLSAIVVLLGAEIDTVIDRLLPRPA